VACAPATGDVELGISKYKLQKSIKHPPVRSKQFQINLNIQISMTKLFRGLRLGIWNLFVIWNLEPGILVEVPEINKSISK